VAKLPESRRRVLEGLRKKDPALAGKRVLIVDDDTRNVYSLSAVLEGQSMEVQYAENGRQALEALRADPLPDAILMDIMMPEMDGYETMQAIRRDERLWDLPIIAVTAKAMRGDREKCIAGGASDYVTKPVEAGRLLTLLRVWLTR
jgi:CheY-like chemotaxis protein